MLQGSMVNGTRLHDEGYKNVEWRSLSMRNFFSGEIFWWGPFLEETPEGTLFGGDPRLQDFTINGTGLHGECYKTVQ